MNLTDIAPLERWMKLENDINARSGMDANVFDIKGYRISPQKHWANRLCPAIKETDKGQSFICAPAHMNLAAQAMRGRATVIEECDAGMIKLVVPIFVGEEFIGAVGACGLSSRMATWMPFWSTRWPTSPRRPSRTCLPRSPPSPGTGLKPWAASSWNRWTQSSPRSDRTPLEGIGTVD